MTDPATGHIVGDVVDDVAVLTLRRPEKLNALDIATRRQLARLVREWGTGERVRGIVLTGEGRAFSAGEDLAHPPTNEAEMHETFATFHDITRAVLETRVPVVAAVNGIAVGGASEITLCCDARIGTPATVYFQPENARGLTISNASSILLPRLVGSHAMRIVLGSPRVDAQEALRIGLIDEIVEPAALLARAVETIHAWTPDGGTTDLHLSLLRPRLDEVEAAFDREDVAAQQAWDDGLLTAGIAGFWSTKEAAS